MSWDYRVIHRKDGEEDLYDIREVYYRRSDGTPWGVMVNSAGPHSETPEGLKDDLEMMRRAVEKETLEFSDFEIGGRFYGRRNEEVEVVARKEGDENGKPTSTPTP